MYFESKSNQIKETLNILILMLSNHAWSLKKTTLKARNCYHLIYIYIFISYVMFIVIGKLECHIFTLFSFIVSSKFVFKCCVMFVVLLLKFDIKTIFSRSEVSIKLLMILYTVNVPIYLILGFFSINGLFVQYVSVFNLWSVLQGTCDMILQSDMEKLEGLPVAPFMDRDKVTKSSSQIGFIKFALLPLFEALRELFPVIEVCEIREL